MNPDTIAQAVATILAPLVTLIGIASRRKRLRTEIRENFALIQELEKDDALREGTPVANWLRGKIIIDVAKLSGEVLATPKKPVPKPAVFFATVAALALSYLTYHIVRNGFVWYSVFPGIGAFLFAVSVYGNLADRELPAKTEDVDGHDEPEDDPAKATGQPPSPRLSTEGDATGQQQSKSEHRVAANQAI